MVTRCKKAAHIEIFGHLPEGKLSVYCCAQFVVSKAALDAQPLEQYGRMLALLAAPSPQECADIPGHSTYCLMYEVFWHVLFGERPYYPFREQNAQLPLFLRVQDRDTSELPKGSMYLDHVQGEPQWE